MKLIFCLAFVFASIQNASALRNAKAADAEEIQEAIDDAVSLQKLIAFKETTPEDERSETFEADLLSLATERKAAYEKAIWLAIRAYDILPFRYGQPALPGGKTSLPSPEQRKQKKISWVPVFEDKQMYRIQDETGEVQVIMNMDKNDVANTASDGISRIWPEAFLSPVELASFLIHEKIHFEQFIDPQRASKTTGAMEVEAYKAQLRLMDNGPLVFTADEARRHRASVNEMISEKKKQIAREEFRLAQGKKLISASIKSHTDVEIDDLITRARLQVQIASKDHDERLQRALIDLTERSCENPGYVRQSELDALAAPHGFLGNLAPPVLRNDCEKVYRYLLDGGRNAESLRALSTRPVVPVDARPIQPPVRPAPLNIRIPFSGSLPSIKNYAVTACGTTDQVPVNPQMATPSFPFEFETGRDDAIAGQLSANLGVCERQLFQLLIDFIRAGKGSLITPHWAQAAAARFRPSPVYQEPYYDPCRANGNKYCP